MELPGVPRDTPRSIERRVIEGLSRMTPAQRFEATMALCRAADELAVAGIRLREGELPESELRLRLAGLRLDADLLARVAAHRARVSVGSGG